MLLCCSPRDTLRSPSITRGRRYSKRRSISFILPESIEQTGSNVLQANTYSQTSRLRPLNGLVKHEGAPWINVLPFVLVDQPHLATIMVWRGVGVGGRVSIHPNLERIADSERVADFRAETRPGGSEAAGPEQSPAQPIPLIGSQSATRHEVNRQRNSVIERQETFPYSVLNAYGLSIFVILR